VSGGIVLAAAERGASGAVPELTALQEQAGQGRACGPIVWAGAGWSWVELESAAFCCLTAEHTDETKSDAPRAHLAYERGWLAVIRLKEGLRADAGAVGLCDSGRAGAGCVHTLALVRDSMRIVHQNLLSAAGYNAVCVPLALLGHMSPWLEGPAGLAGLGMAADSSCCWCFLLPCDWRAKCLRNTWMTPAQHRCAPDLSLVGDWNRLLTSSTFLSLLTPTEN